MRQPGHVPGVGIDRPALIRQRSRTMRACERSYSMTSSGRASSDCGTARLNAFAVLRLTTSSYLVGACYHDQRHQHLVLDRALGPSPVSVRPSVQISETSS